MKTWITCTLFLLLSCGAAFGQQPAERLSFEVASIRPAAPPEMGRIRIGMNADGGMLRYTNVSLREVIRVAYRVKDFQIEGPDWLGNDRFDIQAKFPEGATQDQVPEMLQSLLADRFKLSLHRETKEHAIYALVVGKDGPKLKPAEVQTPNAPAMKDGSSPDQGSENAANAKATAEGARAGSTDRNVRFGGGDRPAGGPGRGLMMMSMDPSGMHLKASSITLGGLGDAISRFTERPVVDMTGIQGQYDFDLAFSPETIRGLQRAGGGPMPPPGGDRPAEGETASAPEQGGSVFDAVQRYGLKLEPRKAPLEILTIDHIEKTPTEN